MAEQKKSVAFKAMTDYLAELEEADKLKSGLLGYSIYRDWKAAAANRTGDVNEVRSIEEKMLKEIVRKYFFTSI